MSKSMIEPPLPHLTGGKLDAETRKQMNKILLRSSLGCLCFGLYYLVRGTLGSQSARFTLFTGFIGIVTGLTGIVVLVNKVRKENAGE